MTSAAAAPRKRPNRNRKRKRRAASVASSSSSSSGDSSDSSSENESIIQTTVPAPANVESSSASSSSSDSDDSDDNEPRSRTQPPPPTRLRSPSPGPIPPSAVRIPSFLPERQAKDDDVEMSSSKEKDDSESALQEKFRQFWMSSIVDGFKDDLDVIRKARFFFSFDPTFTPSKLSVLIDSLAAGAEIYSSQPLSGRREASDMDIILEQ
ncbi:hypothetical protein D9757_008509 [Collybiopsis confluens]|uniref:Ribosome assembly protein 3 n=1 Tax=Collybiopsis confluens TaxID=2823264 RepID=A0A8H5H2T7_9AGAR|nr:hypothetical protein D9757_008509 [Collybiopsis confluens]